MAAATHRFGHDIFKETADEAAKNSGASLPTPIVLPELGSALRVPSIASPAPRVIGNVSSGKGVAWSFCGPQGRRLVRERGCEGLTPAPEAVPVV